VTPPPSLRQVSKKQLCELTVQAVLRGGRSDGTCLSKDRIARIKATAARVRADEEKRDDAAVEGERVHLQDDLAFCFMNGTVKQLWFGKLQQMRTKRGRRTRNVHDSISLINPPNDLKMQLQWYHETRKGSGKYHPSLRTTTVDRTFVDVESCLGLVKLEFKNKFYIPTNNGQLQRFKRLMNSIN